MNSTTSKARCTGTTKAGERCKRSAGPNGTACATHFVPSGPPVALPTEAERETIREAEATEALTEAKRHAASDEREDGECEHGMLATACAYCKAEAAAEHDLPTSHGDILRSARVFVTTTERKHAQDDWAAAHRALATSENATGRKVRAYMRETLSGRFVRVTDAASVRIITPHAPDGMVDVPVELSPDEPNSKGLRPYKGGAEVALKGGAEAIVTVSVTPRIGRRGVAEATLAVNVTTRKRKTSHGQHTNGSKGAGTEVLNVLPSADGMATKRADERPRGSSAEVVDAIVDLYDAMCDEPDHDDA